MIQFFNLKSDEATILSYEGHLYLQDKDHLGKWGCMEGTCSGQIEIYANSVKHQIPHDHPRNYNRVAAAFMKDSIIKYGITAFKKMTTKDVKEIYDAFPLDVSQYLPAIKITIINEIQKLRSLVRGGHGNGPKWFTFCACDILDPNVSGILEEGACKLAEKNANIPLKKIKECFVLHQQRFRAIAPQPQGQLSSLSLPPPPSSTVSLQSQPQFQQPPLPSRPPTISSNSLQLRLSMNSIPYQNHFQNHFQQSQPPAPPPSGISLPSRPQLQQLPLPRCPTAISLPSLFSQPLPQSRQPLTSPTPELPTYLGPGVCNPFGFMPPHGSSSGNSIFPSMPNQPEIFNNTLVNGGLSIFTQFQENSKKCNANQFIQPFSANIPLINPYLRHNLTRLNEIHDALTRQRLTTSINNNNISSSNIAAHNPMENLPSFTAATDNNNVAIVETPNSIEMAKNAGQLSVALEVDSSSSADFSLLSSEKSVENNIFKMLDNTIQSNNFETEEDEEILGCDDCDAFNALAGNLQIDNPPDDGINNVENEAAENATAEPKAANSNQGIQIQMNEIENYARSILSEADKRVQELNNLIKELKKKKNRFLSLSMPATNNLNKQNQMQNSAGAKKRSNSMSNNHNLQKEATVPPKKTRIAENDYNQISLNNPIDNAHSAEARAPEFIESPSNVDIAAWEDALQNFLMLNPKRAADNLQNHSLASHYRFHQINEATPQNNLKPYQIFGEETSAVDFGRKKTTEAEKFDNFNPLPIEEIIRNALEKSQKDVDELLLQHPCLSK